jgi:hypothetical protein
VVRWKGSSRSRGRSKRKRRYVRLSGVLSILVCQLYPQSILLQSSVIRSLNVERQIRRLRADLSGCCCIIRTQAEN